MIAPGCLLVFLTVTYYYMRPMSGEIYECRGDVVSDILWAQ